MSRIDCYESEKKSKNLGREREKNPTPNTWELRKTNYQNSGRGIRGRLSLPGMEGNEKVIGKKELRVGFVI